MDEHSFASLLQALHGHDLLLAANELRKADIRSAYSLRLCSEHQLIGKLPATFHAAVRSYFSSVSSSRQSLSCPSLPGQHATDDARAQVAMAPAIRRKDFPALPLPAFARKDQLRLALAANETPLSRHSALSELEADMYANSSKRPRQSLWATWCKIAAR